MRWAAARSLGQIGDTRAVEPLVAALSDGNWNVRMAAANTLIGMYSSDKISAAHKRLISVQQDTITQIIPGSSDQFWAFTI